MALFQPPRMGAAEKAVAARIEELRTRLRYSVSEPSRWTGLLRRVAFARAVRGSNSIEGIHVSVEDAVAAVDGDEPIDADARTWAAVAGYRNAMMYVLQLANDLHFSYDPNLLRSLHYMMMQYDLSKNPGKWRSGHVYVRNEETGRIVYEGPDSDLVPDLVDELCGWLNGDASDIPLLERAAMAHLNLAMIHPYSDGNGRMARCLQTLVLARDGILAPPFSSIEEYLGRNTQEYYNVLAEVGGGSWQPKRDTLPWVRFVLTAHFRQATTLLRRVKEIQGVWDAIENELSRRNLPQRMIFALADAAFGFHVRNSTYRTVADITQNLASRDLQKLVNAGLLIASGQKRGRSYVACPELKDMRSRYRDEAPIDDPFHVTISSEPC